MRQLRALTSILAIPVAALTLAALAAAPAQAYDLAPNTKQQYLTSTPTSGDLPATVGRPITLVRGCYRWSLVLNGVQNTEDKELAAGAYSWSDTLTPRAGYYDHFSELHTGNLPTARFTDNLAEGVPADGTYLWGSELQWVRQDC